MTDDSEKPTATDGIINDESQVDPNTPTIEVSDVLVLIDKFVENVGVSWLEELVYILWITAYFYHCVVHAS